MRRLVLPTGIAPSAVSEWTQERRRKKSATGWTSTREGRVTSCIDACGCILHLTHVCFMLATNKTWTSATLSLPTCATSSSTLCWATCYDLGRPQLVVTQAGQWPSLYALRGMKCIRDHKQATVCMVKFFLMSFSTRLNPADIIVSSRLRFSLDAQSITRSATY